MIPSAANAAATAAATIAKAFEWTGQPPILPLLLGESAPPSNMVPWAHPSLHPKQYVDRFNRFCTAYHRVSNYFTMRRYVSPKIAPTLWGSGPPSNTWYIPTAIPELSPQTATRSVQSFLYVPNAMQYNTLSMGKKTPKSAPSPRDFVTLPERTERPSHGHRQHAQKNC